VNADVGELPALHRLPARAAIGWFAADRGWAARNAGAGSCRLL